MYQEKLFAYLKNEAPKIDAAMREDLISIKDSALAEIVEYALFNGGKRVRPLLCLLAAGLCDNHEDRAFKLAIAFEYLHVATLLHDDVIDHADTRRGRKAANLIWGTTSAILAGDYLHARSMYLIGDLGGSRALEIICRTTAAMVEGEFQQMHNARDFNQSEEDYFAVIKGKTALLISSVCEIGAIFAQGTDQQTKALNSYGADLGAAFQITDDILDYQGDPGKTGKAVGNDFAECKMTLPLIHALEKASPSDRNFLMDLLTGKEEERHKAIGRVIPILEKYDGFQYSRQKAGHFVAQAIKELEFFPAAAARHDKDILTGLAHFVLNREK